MVIIFTSTGLINQVQFRNSKMRSESVRFWAGVRKSANLSNRRQLNTFSFTRPEALIGYDRLMLLPDLHSISIATWWWKRQQISHYQVGQENVNDVFKCPLLDGTAKPKEHNFVRNIIKKKTFLVQSIGPSTSVSDLIIYENMCQPNYHLSYERDTKSVDVNITSYMN